MSKNRIKLSVFLTCLLIVFSNISLSAVEGPPTPPSHPNSVRPNDANKNPAQAGQQGQPGQSGHPEHPMPPKPGTRPPKNSVINYRGTRMPAVNDFFFVKTAKYCKVNEKFIEMEVAFNQSINPKSIKPSLIVIDGAELPEDTKFSFNKKGDTVRFSLPVGLPLGKLKVRGLLSYTGTLVMPAEILIQPNLK